MKTRKTGYETIDMEAVESIDTLRISTVTERSVRPVHILLIIVSLIIALAILLFWVHGIAVLPKGGIW